MNMRGLSAVFCLMIMYTVDVCDAECDEYVVVFEETTCSGRSVRLKPLKKREINWDKVTYPCNSTEKNPGKKKCVVEFDCMGTERDCKNHIIKVNHQTHTFIDNLTTKTFRSTTEALHVTKTNNTDVPKSNNTDVSKSSISHLPKSNNTDVPKTNITDVPRSNNTDVPKSNMTHVPKSNLTVEEKPHHIGRDHVDEELNTSTYDVNFIYIKDSVKQDSSKTSVENCTFYCDYAETVCIDGEKPEKYSLSDVKNIHTLEIAINRDETSSVQPVFTGYFPESSNDSSTNYKNNFKDFKTVSLSCSSLKYKNCTQNIVNKSSKQMNVYIKANCIENNTITKYPNCTKNSITSENVLNLKCEDILFAKHNLHIVQTLPTPPPKLSTWNCEITEFKTLSSKEQRSENRKIHFINCSNKTNISTNKNKYKDINVTPISDNKTTNIYNILTKNRIEMNMTEISTTSRKEEINKDPENIITILITEKPNNCSDISYFNINEGKIIDLGIKNNKEKILQNNNVELILSNCINVSSSTINETQPHPKAELNIILKNESINNSNLKHFNGTPEDLSVTRRILLRCDHPNLDLSSNKTVLQCESIDLDLYNITGIEITPLSQTSNNTTAIASKTKQEVSNWNCTIFELNDTLSPKEQHSEKSKLYFKNCANDVNINDSNNKSGDNSVTPIYDSKNRTIDSITTTTETTDSTKDTIKKNKTEMPSGKLLLNTTTTDVSPENMLKIVVTEKADNCSNNPSLNIDEGKIIDLGANNNEKKFLQNNIVELKLSNCIDIDSSINNESLPNPKVELTIILKNESLNDANLKQFNGTAKVGSVKQRILLQCDHLKLDSNTTVLQCESIDLDLYNITGIEITTNVSPASKLNANNTKEKKKENIKMIEENHKQTKVNTEVNKNNIFSTNKAVENNEDNVNNKSNENNTKVVGIKEVQKKVSESEEKWNTLNFNRKKDIPVGARQNVLALVNPETERILLIALLTVTSVAIVIVFALRACPNKREYSPAPTREPQNEEETAF